MLDISKLERRWLKYKIKSMLPYALSALLVIALILIIPMMSQNNPSTAPISSTKISTNNNEAPLAKPLKSSTDRMILEPSMDFLQSIVSPLSSAQSIPTTPIPVAPITPKKPEVSQPNTEPIAPPPIIKPLIAPIQKGKLTSIKRDDAAFDIHELEERFKNNSNPNLGLYVARYHYDHGNYTESYNYALKTNAINSNIEESWLIFAKSLVKLGKEDQAKKTLQLYISNSNSQNAKNYLDTISKESTK